jgi:hypothetical protein
VFRCVLGSEGCVLVPRSIGTPVATWAWQIWVVSRRCVLEAVFILLEFPSPLRRIFIGSHSLPPLWFAVSVLQGGKAARNRGRRRSAGGDLGFIGRRREPWRARHARQDGGGLAGRGVFGLCGRLGPDGLRSGHDRAGGDGLDRVGPTACAWAELKKRTAQGVRGAPADFGLMGQKQMWAEKDERKR